MTKPLENFPFLYNKIQNGIILNPVNHEIPLSAQNLFSNNSVLTASKLIGWLTGWVFIYRVLSWPKKEKAIFPFFALFDWTLDLIQKNP